MNTRPPINNNTFEAKAGRALKAALETKLATMGLKLKPAPALK